MAPRKQQDAVVGELVWVTEGKTEHPAHLPSNKPPVITDGIRYLCIKFSTGGLERYVPETTVRKVDAESGRRSRRATRTDAQGNGETQPAIKKEEKEESKTAPGHKRSKRQQEGRPGKKARTEITYHIPPCLYAAASNDESEIAIDWSLAGKALRTADEMIPTVNRVTTTVGGMTVSVLAACSIEDDMEHYNLYYDIIKTRIYEVVTGKVHLKI